jgi:transcriptional regulator with XRE-family HTH domain
MSMITDGISALATFLKRHELTQLECARAIGVSNVAVHHWLEGVQRPRERHREAIETWTKGAVPASWWLTDEERAQIAQIKPFQSNAESTHNPAPPPSRRPKRGRAAA